MFKTGHISSLGGSRFYKAKFEKVLEEFEVTPLKIYFVKLFNFQDANTFNS